MKLFVCSNIPTVAAQGGTPSSVQPHDLMYVPALAATQVIATLIQEIAKVNTFVTFSAFAIPIRLLIHIRARSSNGPQARRNLRPSVHFSGRGRLLIGQSTATAWNPLGRVVPSKTSHTLLAHERFQSAFSYKDSELGLRLAAKRATDAFIDHTDKKGRDP
jgi:hypothetical protein